MFWVVDALFLMLLQCTLLLCVLAYYHQMILVLSVFIFTALGMYVVIKITGHCEIFMPDGTGVWGRKVWPSLIGYLLAVAIYIIGYIYIRFYRN
jgi:hypothetical protein